VDAPNTVAVLATLSSYDLPDPDWEYGTDDGLAEAAADG
jgi:hypothetical protein